LRQNRPPITQRRFGSDMERGVDLYVHPFDKYPSLPNRFGKRFAVSEAHELTVWLRKAYLAFHRRVNSIMLNHGITTDQFIVLRVVAGEPGITQTNIVERIASDPNTVTAIIKLLELRGLLRREAHANDRRARCVFLTPAGCSLERRSFYDSEPLRAALRSCVHARDYRQNLQFLQRVHQVFSAPLTGAKDQAAKRKSADKKAR
jgi:DNA-binding MarR family transcriptional regulator